MPSKNKSSEAASTSDEAIRQRAYLLWEAEGRPHGMHEHYWHRAAAEISANGHANGAKPAAKSAAAKPEKAKAATPVTAAKAPKEAEAAAPSAKVKKSEPVAAKKADTKPRAAVGARKAKATT